MISVTIIKLGWINSPIYTDRRKSENSMTQRMWTYCSIVSSLETFLRPFHVLLNSFGLCALKKQNLVGHKISQNKCRSLWDEPIGACLHIVLFVSSVSAILSIQKTLTYLGATEYLFTSNMKYWIFKSQTELINKPLIWLQNCSVQLQEFSRITEQRLQFLLTLIDILLLCGNPTKQINPQILKLNTFLPVYGSGVLSCMMCGSDT